jgi:hypothetical protein
MRKGKANIQHAFLALKRCGPALHQHDNAVVDLCLSLLGAMAAGLDMKPAS